MSLAPIDNKIIKANPKVFPNLFDSTDIIVDSLSFGQSQLSYYKNTPTGVSLNMSDGTNTYNQSLVLERVGNMVKIVLKSVSSPVAAVNIINSLSGLPLEYRPATACSFIFPATYPGGSTLPALKLSITSGGILQIRKLDGSAYSGVGTIAYDDCPFCFSVV
jgi:hypothetical protein